MNNNVEQIQKLLRNGETCRFCIEGSLISGWTRTPHFFAIVRSPVNNHGLLILSHPGIGSKESSIRPKHAIPIDSNFRYLLNRAGNDQFSSELQLQLSFGSVTHNAEFLDGPVLQEFMTMLTGMYNSGSGSTSFDWLQSYDESQNNTNDANWPWSEITKPPESNYTPLAFDADVDITSFDPLNSSSSSSKNDQNVNDTNKRDTELLTGQLQNLDFSSIDNNTFQHENQNNSEIGISNPLISNDLDLKDFDPLSKEEIEHSIKSEKMLNAELLRRSRDVVSNRVSASKSWIERTFSQGSIDATSDTTPVTTDTTTTATSTTTGEMNGYYGTDERPQDDAFDVVDNLEAQNARNADVSPPPLLGSRSSSVFKGMRARENYIKLHMAAREKEFTELYDFTVLAGTWNVNGQIASESLVPWLQSTEVAPDVIACGFQELDLSAEALVFNDSSREDTWIKAVENGLPKTADYFKLKHVRLVGMMLVVFVQTKHKMQVFDCESETNGTGIMGMMGNKGGVAIRFQLHNSTLCFINSHLAAHLAEFERRNQDFREVYSKLKFTLFQPPLSISDHDLVFWLGDLNYRFDELDPEQVKSIIEERNWEKLHAYDQLNRQRKIGKTFHGFTEGDIRFPPTYKFDPGTDDWDTSEKGRAPAWCDRVLYRGKHIKQLHYKCHPQLLLSDHKPVSAWFTTGEKETSQDVDVKNQIKVVDRTRERKVFEEIVWKLDKRENESLPQVKLGKHEFQFDNVHFMEERIEVLPIANIGKGPVAFEFIPKLDDTLVAKPWIKANPGAGFVMPGDVLEIELCIFVDKESAPLVTVGNCQLDDILVLHLIDGKDFFVPINGNYLPSVFGSSLEALVRIYGPITQVPMDSLLRLENIACAFDSTDGTFPDPTEPLEIPKELWLLIDHLYKHGMLVENILIQNGTDEEIRHIQQHLDSGQGGTIPGSEYSIGEALLLFLEALPEPVIPYKYQARCLEACNNYVLCKQVITQLPECHGNVFRYLTAFLRELLKKTNENKLEARMLGKGMFQLYLNFTVSVLKDGFFLRIVIIGYLLTGTILQFSLHDCSIEPLFLDLFFYAHHYIKTKTLIDEHRHR